MNIRRTKQICIFCGHRSGKKNIWVAFAKQLGDFIGKNGYTLIYGAGSRGMMGTVASAAKHSGATVHGIITEGLAETEPILPNIDNLIIVETLNERKEKLFENADVAVVLPGGIGTIDEFFDLWAKIQLGLEEKTLIIANINDYYSKLFSFIGDVVQEDFLSESSLSKIRVCNSLDELISELES